MSRLSRFAVNAAKKAAAKAAARTAATAERTAPSLSVPRTRTKPVVKALPAPPKPLALPAPEPGLPPLASKPRGGQWWINKEIEGVNSSPEAVASQQAGDLGYRFLEWQPDDDYGLISPQVPEIPKEQFAVQDWLSRALAKYYKNDFGSPEDPLRALAERGLHYDPDMTPEKWKATVDSYLLEDPLQSILFPPNREGGMPGAGSNLRGGVLSQMPWLAKAPVTDNVYGISGGGLDLEHFADEFYNALNPEVSGLPADLAVRPESLARMSFPQAVERVGRINQFRAKEMERAALSNLNSPAIQTFKEYADDNPMGLRWVELRTPEPTDDLLDDMDRGLVDLAVKEGRTIDPAHMDEVRTSRARKALEDALKYEGDTMGHCVGGYCDDVIGGRSRIFSLRDAKGEPHVTIETAPKELYDLADEDPELGELFNTYHYTDAPDRDLWFGDWLAKHAPETLARLPQQDIVQIKGKQNRAPKDDYLPFVQDFVKSQQWGNVGDLRNTGLVKLPDGRYITQQQMDQAISDNSLDDLYQSYDFNARQFPRDPSYMDPEDWAQFQRHFEGFAIGGRVDADRCFCRHPMSVRKNK